MKLPLLRGFCLVVLGLVVSAAPVLAQPQLPEMELRVIGVEDTPEINPDTADRWVPLESGRTLKVGDRVRTDEDASVELEVPSVSYLRVTESSLVEVRKLERSQEERGLIDIETVTVNDVELRELRGKVQSSLRRREGMATDYELRTPNAVAGVRGTDFQCEVTEFGRTNCSVLDGEVAFSSLENRDASVSLGAGQQSSIGPEQTRPGDPTEISDEAREELRSVQERAQSALQLPPRLSSLELNGTEFQQSISLSYSSPTSLTLSGSAAAPEDNAELTTVGVSVNGEQQSVDGLSDWSLDLEPEVPASGERRTLTVTVTAVDSNDNRSETTLKITLVNQSEQTETEGLPENYESGQVDVKLASLAGKSPGGLEFPFRLYRPDATEGGLTLRGTASGDASIENVAYSIDDGQTWRRASGAENWTISLPDDQSGEFTVRVRAWTTEGVIGQAVEYGPIVYEPISYEQAMRETFEGFWTAFERQNARGVVEYVHPDFQYEPAGGGSGGAERREVLDRSGFQDFLREEFNDWINLRVFYSINTIFGNSTGGNLSADPIQWKFQEQFDGQQDQGSTARYFPAAINEAGNFKYRRDPNGHFKILSFEDFNPTFFHGFDNITMGDTDGYNRGPASSVIDNDPGPENNPFGWLIAGLNTDNTLWPGNPPRLYVNPDPGNYTGADPVHAWCGCNNGEVLAGGIYRTPYSNFSRVERIPGVSSSKYGLSADLTEGAIYAVNIKLLFGERLTYLLKVTELNQLNSTPTVDEVVLRAVVPSIPNTTSFEVNPFE